MEMIEDDGADLVTLLLQSSHLLLFLLPLRSLHLSRLLLLLLPPFALYFQLCHDQLLYSSLVTYARHKKSQNADKQTTNHIINGLKTKNQMTIFPLYQRINLIILSRNIN